MTIGSGVVWREVKQLSVLAAPLVVAQLAQSSMVFVDTLMVGRLGPVPLAGMALGSAVFMFILIVCMGVLFAVGPLVAQAYGADDRHAVGRFTRQGLWLAAGLSALAVAIFWNAGPLLQAMGQDVDATALAAAYLRAVSWGFLPALGLVVLRCLLEGLTRPKPVMFIALLGVALNIALDYLLIFGHGGFPRLGLVGAGYATSIVYTSMFGAACLYISLSLRSWRIFSGLRRPDLSAIREIFSIGWPIGVTLGFESGLFTATALLMGLFGQVQLAAHQIAIQSASITFMIAVGVSIAIAVRVAQAVGRKDPRAARRTGLVGIGVTMAYMSCTALAFWLLPRPIVGLYVDLASPENARVIAHAIAFLGIAAMFQLFDGLQVSALGALRGLKDTRVPMLLSLVAYWLVGMGTGTLLAFGLNTEGMGLWFGLVTGLATAGILLFVRFNRTIRGRQLAAQRSGGLE